MRLGPEVRHQARPLFRYQQVRCSTKSPAMEAGFFVMVAKLSVALMGGVAKR
ncbi:hypothetical protein EP10_002936 [Geobacillus icigianus]|uniref:Uncharacterized protein n=1 Tax=Geobacillus icigianus TaxID=1430331 RepID=A0ABU6BJD7_9BACL|nr:hypothetical protein [Geobacillus icigianus]